jgi:hypothetical protein
MKPALPTNTFARIYEKTVVRRGHLLWTGYVHRNLGPCIAIDQTPVSVRRLLFLAAYPELAEMASCGIWRCPEEPTCVEPAHGRVLIAGVVAMAAMEARC